MSILRTLEHAEQVRKVQTDQILYKAANVEGDMESVKQSLNAVEIVTAKNWNDIIHLKAVQNL